VLRRPNREQIGCEQIGAPVREQGVDRVDWTEREA